MRLLTFKRPTPHTSAFLLFLLFYLLAILSIRSRAYRDPTSLFFDPARAFERKYSLLREERANAYIESATLDAQAGLTPIKAGNEAEICVGITTAQREGVRYFQRTVGSILAGLNKEERQDLWLVPFFVNLDPQEHDAFNESWLTHLTDEVLTYPTAPEEFRQTQREFRPDGGHFQKALWDYTYLLRTCYAKGMPWIMMLEDDVIGAGNWYARTKSALEELAGRSDFHTILYLRLFYNERILGWNSEEAGTYIFCSLVVELGVAVLLFCTLRYLPSHLRIRAYLTPRTTTTLLLLLTPACITLFFISGRLTTLGPSYGLHRMDSYGCCSQAFLFPREQIPDLISFYEGQLEYGGYVDVLTEYYANMKGLGRWALTPAAFQHVGTTSSKGSFVSRWGRSNTENIWNFSFEEMDGREMGKEHLGWEEG